MKRAAGAVRSPAARASIASANNSFALRQQISFPHHTIWDILFLMMVTSTLFIAPRRAFIAFPRQPGCRLVHRKKRAAGRLRAPAGDIAFAPRPQPL
jgi:hypothetical protein